MYVDLSDIVLPKPILYLCKPNREIIGVLDEAYGLKHSVRFGQVSELSFVLPYEIEVNHTLIPNPHIELVRYKYQIKYENDTYEEWYVIDTPTSKSSNDENTMEVSCFSLPYELGEKLIRNYQKDSLTATEFLVDILDGTIWSVGYVAANFDLMHRSFDVSNLTVLDLIFQGATTFGGIVSWDTINREVNLYEYEQVGVNRGLVFDYGKYIQDIEHTVDTENFCTRLYILGKDGAFINGVNPTGQAYIEDYSYFMRGFSRESTGPLSLPNSEISTILQSSSEIKEVELLALNVNAKDYGVLGDGITDDTAAINNLITTVSNAGGGVIFMPAGTYMINAVYSASSGIMFKNNVFIEMDPEATIKVIPNSAAVYYTVRFPDTCTNAGISGGKILGDVGYHTGTTGEWGIGIYVSGATDIYISDMDISYCWGDGIDIYRGTAGARIYSQNIVINNIRCHHNRRGGFFVCTVHGLTVINGEFDHNGLPEGTAPRFGIIFEPNHPDEDIQGVYFEDCTVHDNVGTGINFALSNVAGPNSYSTTPIDIIFKNVTSYGNSYPTWTNYGYSGGDVGTGRAGGYTGWNTNRTNITFDCGKIREASWTSMLVNKDFTNSYSTGWTISGGTILSTSGGIVTAQATSNTVYFTQNIGTLVVGRKYFFRAYVRNYQTTAGGIVGRLSGGEPDGEYTFPNEVAHCADISANGPNYTKWTLLSGVICPIAVQSGDSNFQVYVYGTGSGRLIQLRNCELIDLTAKYGIGNEPNSAECLELFSLTSGDSTVFNVLDYGAVGDGIINDTVAINNTILAAKNSGGGTVYIPTGTYLVTPPGYYTTVDRESAINMKSNVAVVCDNATIIKTETNGQMYCSTIGFYQVVNASWTGGQILGDRSTHTVNTEWSHGIKITASNNCELSDIYISNFCGDGLSLSSFNVSTQATTYPSDIIINDVICEYNGRTGAAIINGKNITLTNCEGNYNGRAAEGQAHGTNSGFDIEPDPYPTSTEWSTSILYNIRFINCTTKDNGDANVTNTNYGKGLNIWMGNLSHTVPMPKDKVKIEFINYSDTGSYHGDVSNNLYYYINNDYDIQYNESTYVPIPTPPPTEEDIPVDPYVPNGYITTGHSLYMSDNLCHAILDYQDKISHYEDYFFGLLTNLGILQEELAILMINKVTLDETLAEAQDELDIAQSLGQSTSELLIIRDNALNNVNTQVNQINAKNAEITVILQSIDNLNSVIGFENNFTPAQIIELNQYVVEKEISNEYISNPQQLYDWGKKALAKIIEPVINIDISIVNLLLCLDAECIIDKTKISLAGGDIVTIKYDKFDVDIEANIVELDLDYDSDNIKLTISNVKDISRDKDKFLDIINKSMSTNTTVDMNKYKWNGIESTANEVQILLNGLWSDITNSVNTTINDNVSLSRQGIIVTDPLDPSRIVRITHGVVAISNDGGRTYKNALTSSGLVAERIIGQILIGESLLIDASNDTLGQYFRVDETGVYINGLGLTIEGGDFSSYDEGAIHFDTNYTNLTGTSVLHFDADTGITATDVNGLARLNIDISDPITRRVFRIQKRADINDPWTDVFYNDVDGNLHVIGEISGSTITASLIEGNTITGSTIAGGEAVFGDFDISFFGDDTIRINNYGIWAGDQDMEFAPFSVDIYGNLKATGAEVEGIVSASTLILGGQEIFNTIEGMLSARFYNFLNKDQLRALIYGGEDKKQKIEYINELWDTFSDAGEVDFIFESRYTVKLENGKPINSPVYVIHPDLPAHLLAEDENGNIVESWEDAKYYCGVRIPIEGIALGTTGTIYNLIAVCEDFYDPEAEQGE